MTDSQEVMKLRLGDFLDQTEWWVTKSGMLTIDDMSSVHRRRAAMILLRKSPTLAVIDLVQELVDEQTHPTISEIFFRVGAPQDWVKEKALYQKIIDAPDADPDLYYADHHVKI